MVDQSNDPGGREGSQSLEPEDKRLALDWARLRADQEKAAAELDLRRQEIEGAKAKGWREALSNPLVLAITGGFLTIMTTIVSSYFTVSANIQLEGTKARLASTAEQEKAERADKATKLAFQADLIKKFAENPNSDTVRENLKFLAEAGLIPDYKDDISAYLKDNPDKAPQVGTEGDVSTRPRTLTAEELNGFVVHVSRTREERREADGRRRTVGRYRVTYKGQEISALTGFTAETRGPGNNSIAGSGVRLEAGGYPLFTNGGTKYVTWGYSANEDIDGLPRPSIGVRNTGKRVGILIHPGTGFLSAIGTVNLSNALNGPTATIDYKDSRRRVIALIEAMREKLGTSFPSSNGSAIPDAWLNITDEATDEPEDDDPN